MRPPAVICMTVVLAVAGATSASAAELEFLGTSEERLITDGTRFAVFKSSATKLTVRDDARRRRFRLSVAQSCVPQDASRSGFLLLTCSPADGQHHVVDLRERKSTRVPESQSGSSLWYDPANEGFGRVGSRWLEGTSGRGLLYLDWRTGEGRRGPADDDTYTPYDLDSASLDQLGPPQPHGFAFDKVGAFSIAQVDRDPTPQGSLAGDLALYRDGSATSLGTRVATLSRCRLGCLNPTLGAGLVTWADDRAIRVYAVGTGRRASWRFSRRVGGGVEHTRTTVYWSRLTARTAPWSLYALPLARTGG